MVALKLLSSSSFLFLLVNSEYQYLESCDGANSNDPGQSQATATFPGGQQFNLTIEKIFCAYGISDQVAEIFEYGCWCGMPFGGEAFKGKPADEFVYRRI